MVVDPENRLYGGEGVSIEARAPSSWEEGRELLPSSTLVTRGLDAGVLLSAARALELGTDAQPLLVSGRDSWATPAVAGAEEDSRTSTSSATSAVRWSSRRRESCRRASGRGPVRA